MSPAETKDQPGHTGGSLLELASRCEKATGPDRELDAEIHRLMRPDDAGTAPDYTGHVVAATILFEKSGSDLARAIATAALRDRALSLARDAAGPAKVQS